MNELKKFSFSDISPDTITISYILLTLLASFVVTFLIRRSYKKNINSKDLIKRVLLLDFLGPALATIVMIALNRWKNPDLNHASIHLAMVIFGSMAIIRAVAQLLRRLFANYEWTRWVINTVSLFVWMILVFHLLGVLDPIMDALKSFDVPIGKNSLSAWDLIQGLFSTAITLFIALWLSSFIEARLIALPIQPNLKMVLSRFVRSILFLFAILIALAAAGIDLTVLSVFGGALGVGLGFGLQKITANYISGFLILFEGSVRVGDRVRVDTFEGDVTSINTRYTVLRNNNGVEAIIPNESLITSRVENLTLLNRRLSLNTSIGVAYHSDVEQTLNIIKAAVSTVPRVLQNPEPSANLQQFSDSAIQIAVSFWISDPENGQGNVISQVNLVILKALRDHNIEMPFPQRVLHITRDQLLETPTQK